MVGQSFDQGLIFVRLGIGRVMQSTENLPAKEFAISIASLAKTCGWTVEPVCCTLAVVAQ
jgi:hypothetical protein